MLLIFCYKFTGKYVSLNSCGEWVKYQCGSVFALSLVLDNLFATIFQIYSVYVIKVYFRHLRIDEKLGFQQLGEGLEKGQPCALSMGMYTASAFMPSICRI